MEVLSNLCKGADLGDAHLSESNRELGCKSIGRGVFYQRRRLKSHWCEVFGTGHNHAALIIGFPPDPRSELDVALCGVLRNKVKKEAEGWSG